MAPASINDFFIQREEIHQHNARGALMHSMRTKSAIAWNAMQYELGFNFKDCDFKTLKKRFFNSLFAAY